jgi:hypothetical protein
VRAFPQEAMLLCKPEKLPLGAAPLGVIAPAACAALTSSTSLCTLRLHNAELPWGAWLHMFPAGRQLSQLKALHLQDITPKLSDTDFEQLVRCATALTGLTLLRVLHTHVSLDALLQLSGLRELELWHLHGDSGARVMAQLTGLHRLHNDDANLSPAGLLRLTALKQLTNLHMHYSPDSWSLPRPVRLHTQVLCQQIVINTFHLLIPENNQASATSRCVCAVLYTETSLRACYCVKHAPTQGVRGRSIAASARPCARQDCTLLAECTCMHKAGKGGQG